MNNPNGVTTMRIDYALCCVSEGVKPQGAWDMAGRLAVLVFEI